MSAASAALRAVPSRSPLATPLSANQARSSQLKRENPEPRLTAVPTPTPRRLTAPLWLAIALLVAGSTVLPVLINTQMAMTSYEMTKMQIELSSLMDKQSSLVTEVQQAQSPARLGQAAREIGLVPAQAPGFISLEDGTVTGGKAAQ